MSGSNTFTLDGKDIPFEDGDTIMDAALRAGEYIPHLCHNPEFPPHGSCRVCLVEANGRRVSACTQPAAAGMQVDSASQAIGDARRSLLQMLFVEGNHVCPGCEKARLPGICTDEECGALPVGNVVMFSPQNTPLPPGKSKSSGRWWITSKSTPANTISTTS